jgi:hypothetical protein
MDMLPQCTVGHRALRFAERDTVGLTVAERFYSIE